MTISETSSNSTRPLTWARDEVLELVDRMANAVDDDDFVAVTGRLARLVNDTSEPAKRLALLLQLSVAVAATVELAEGQGYIDRERLSIDLAPALRTDLSVEAHSQHRAAVA
ncbi:MAG: hypothetical protein OEY23_08295 [Acidimicrobiia bacterium]|nr:hypothetical protein [Acidimicrobiia bacterium]